jgi:hypothetical protein
MLPIYDWNFSIKIVNLKNPLSLYMESEHYTIINREYFE